MPIGETIVTLVGNLTADPELTHHDGVARCTFTVASNSRNWDRDRAEWGEGRSLFLRCTAWRWLAEHADASLTKGTRVVVTGALRQFDYTSADGAQRTGYSLDLEEIAVSLRFATATVNRTVRSDSALPTDDPWASATQAPSSLGRGSRSSGSRRAKDAPANPNPWDTPVGGGGFSDEPPF